MYGWLSLGIGFPGGGFMCRRNVTLGVGLMCLGWGAIGGCCFHSWFWCGLCALILIGTGFYLVRKK